MRIYRVSVKSLVSVIVALAMLFNLTSTSLARPLESGSVPRPAPTTNVAAAASVQTAAMPAALQPPDGASGPTGSSAPADLITGAQADLFTGALVTKYPIQVPPGRQGIQPYVALTYNNQQGTGPLGMGWNLQLGTIQRSTKNGVPSYDNGDTFSWSSPLGSAELVPVGSGEYRAKIEGQFQKFVYHGNYWEVWDKAGIKYTYGQNTLTCNQAPYACLNGGLGVFQWNLSRVVDTYGNYMTLDYVQNQGQIYPQNIAWTGNEATGQPPYYHVVFGWEGRPDAPPSFRSGTLIVTAWRLATITISVAGTLVNRYNLGYAQSSITHRSVLVSVEQVGADWQTSLPATAFTYNSPPGMWQEDSTWQLPDGNFVWQGGDDGRRLADVNGDGLVDLLVAKGGNGYSYTAAWINNGNGWTRDDTWSIPSGHFVWNGGDDGRRLVDVNGDGLVDLVVAKENLKETYINTGTGWPQYSDPTWEIEDGNFIWQGKDDGRRLVDVNGDGLVDLLAAKCNNGSSYKAVWINNGHGWTKDDSWIIPDGYGCLVSDGKDAGRRLADVNGDGLVDLLAASNTEPPLIPGAYKGAWINNGQGWTRDDTWVIPDGYFVTFHLKVYGYHRVLEAKDNGRRLVDVNGDGLVDLLAAIGDDGFSYHSAWINNGQGWTRDDTWVIPSGHFIWKGGDDGRRLVDVNGDGTIDLLVAKDDAKSTHLNQKIQADLLVNMENGIGGSTTITYQPSTAYNNTRLPYPIQTVHSVTQNDGLGNMRVVQFYYGQGYHDPVEHEFRGFGYARATDPEGNNTHNWFHQDAILYGRVFQVEQRAPGNLLYTRRENTWGTRTIIPGVTFPYLVQSDNHLFDGNDNVDPFHTRVSYEYDDYGNTTHIHHEGDVNTAGDEKSIEVDYTYNPTAWILNTPYTTRHLDASGNLTKQGWIYYDGHANLTDPPTHGAVTKAEDWLDSNGNGIPDAGDDNPIALVAYDGYGNTVQTTNARGYSSTIEYESLLYQYPMMVTNALGHQTLYSYQASAADGVGAPDGYLWGVPNAVTNANGQTTRTIYDALGRTIKVIGPDDTLDMPTIEYEYKADLAPGELMRLIVRARERTGSPERQVSLVYFDGLGRPVQQKRINDDDPSKHIVSGAQVYNGRGLVVGQYLPFYTPFNEDEYSPPDPNAPHLTYEYDALGRTTRIINADSTFSTIEYDRDRTTYTDANEHQRTNVKDAYGRLIQVIECNDVESYTTTYEYNSLGHLVHVVDSVGNETSIAYDTLGRKVAMDDPDMGTWSYTYDAVGNLVAQTDARGQTIQFEYDPLNRLTRKDYTSGTDAIYTYDQGTYALGRLSQVRDASGMVEYVYDNLGRVIESTKTLDGQRFTVQTEYDLLGRLTWIEYPDGEELHYHYDRTGHLEHVGGFVDHIAYNALGQITQVEYGNGTFTNYTYDTIQGTYRLLHLYTEDAHGAVLQDLAYTYDNVGNVASITDSAGTASQTFAYDDLNRLVEATGFEADGAPYTRSYSYDAIGNLTGKAGIAYDYDDPDHVHAVSSTSDGKQYEYDANGNMLNDGTRHMAYDVENRLTRVVMDSGVTEFVYDSSGARVKKIDNLGNTTLYLGDIFEKSRFHDTRHIFAGGMLIASVTRSRGSSLEQVYYYHGDHLGSTSVVSNDDGELAGRAEYYPFGETKHDDDMPRQVARRYTGQELDGETGLYYYNARYYNPTLARFLSADTIVSGFNNPQTLNRYSYVTNNPLRYLDPSGHWSISFDFLGFHIGISDSGISVGAFGFKIGYNWNTNTFSAGVNLKLFGYKVNDWEVSAGIEFGISYNASNGQWFASAKVGLGFSSEQAKLGIYAALSYNITTGRLSGATIKASLFDERLSITHDLLNGSTSIGIAGETGGLRYSFSSNSFSVGYGIFDLEFSASGFTPKIWGYAVSYKDGVLQFTRGPVQIFLSSQGLGFRIELGAVGCVEGGMRESSLLLMGFHLYSQIAHNNSDPLKSYGETIDEIIQTKNWIESQVRSGLESIGATNVRIEW